MKQYRHRHENHLYQSRGDDGKFERYGKRYAAGSRLIEQGRTSEVERVLCRSGIDCLVQCWDCNKVQTRKVGFAGRPGEIRCMDCEGECELLKVY